MCIDIYKNNNIYIYRITIYTYTNIYYTYIYIYIYSNTLSRSCKRPAINFSSWMLMKDHISIRRYSLFDRPWNFAVHHWATIVKPQRCWSAMDSPATLLFQTVKAVVGRCGARRTIVFFPCAPRGAGQQLANRAMHGITFSANWQTTTPTLC